MNAYYNVSTVFYEWAWGSSFHFAPRKPYETFNGAILRHEMRLADRLGIKENSKVLDIGYVVLKLTIDSFQTTCCQFAFVLAHCLAICLINPVRIFSPLFTCA